MFDFIMSVSSLFFLVGDFPCPQTNLAEITSWGKLERDIIAHRAIINRAQGPKALKGRNKHSLGATLG